MRWLETHSTPQREKSLFSQLKGGGSFGERVARRLEAEYGMGSGFLDSGAMDKTSNKGQKPPLSGEAKALVSWIERTDGLGDPARKLFFHLASILELAQTMGQTQNHRTKPTTLEELSEAEDFLRGVARNEEPGAPSHATRKRAAK
jgi:hypothetical protein